MKQLINWFYKSLNLILVLCMVGMFILIFINVVLRMGFESGIDISEEAPRFLFVWMTFIGAIVAMRDKAHISVNLFVLRMPRFLQRICYLFCNLLISICCVYMFYSSYLQVDIIYYTITPVMQISMFFVYGISFIAAPVIGINALYNIVRVIMDRVPDHELALQPRDEDLNTGHGGE